MLSTRPSRSNANVDSLEVLLNSNDEAHPTFSAFIHQSLYHPSIISLFSAFSTPTQHVTVIEFCVRGTLASYLDRVQETMNTVIGERTVPNVTTESELRCVTKSLVDGLIYLRKEGILHGNIKPSNVFLTEDYRIKLGDFSLAEKLLAPSIKSSSDCRCQYTAPEIRCGEPYTFTADIWSLGCLMLCCLLGTGTVGQAGFDFEATEASQLLDGVSFEARDLISGLLQISLRTKSTLEPTPTSLQRLNPKAINLIQLKRNHSNSENDFLPPNCANVKLGTQGPHSSSRILAPSKLKLNQVQSQQALGLGKPLALVSLGDKKSLLGPGSRISSNKVGLDGRKCTLRDLLRMEMDLATRTRAFSLSGDQLRRHQLQDTRRIVSAPERHTSGLGLGSLASEFNLLPVRIPAGHRPLSESWKFHSSPEEREGREVAAVVDKLVPLGQNYPPPASAESGSFNVHTAPVTINTNVNQVEAPPSPPSSAVPVGTTRPIPFSTLHLAPHTHKLSNGQITILPSRSVVVDLREKERRRGGKGDEVFLVDPGGKTVSIYSAPHLSTACCLAEPKAAYPIQNLPPAYWKQYSDAALVILQMKRHTPKLVAYLPRVKLTLMANDPPGDVELLLFLAGHFHHHAKQSKRTSDNSSNDTPEMRIRLSRERRWMEISRCLTYGPTGKGREWTNKTLILSDNGSQRLVGLREWESLDEVEKDGIKHIVNFLRVCESADELEIPKIPTKDSSRNLGATLSGNLLASTTRPVDDASDEDIPLPRFSPESHDSTRGFLPWNPTSRFSSGQHPSTAAFSSLTLQVPARPAKLTTGSGGPSGTVNFAASDS
ncbi:hypothetical protein JAAARDRAFT_189704 [Jaapia argillacea MUCL 33604]|uniref:Uncharacterized protein n=1 Tax=Jaapia argillacea MUCL 33604 TaxID=933084 RepID=A0A067QFT4_9AGAM|nr:hypothetical protein JAAARDRAFT_189704 [Jaapia argillacea MUCL 33604]